MLRIKNVTKVYVTDGFKQKALNDVSVNFRQNEFAAILGPSGSGKTTFLNIIGGLDEYTSGDLVVNEVSTKKFKDRDWDSYRNHRVGFVFQSYNLIGHQSVLRNVELALTLSGVSKRERKRRALKALKEVGLGEHANKRPNQLSGGQMQRVAIARALVNDPEIVLADEPTGALDSQTSLQIMDIMKKVANDRLVIMVTHNPELADKYSNRIINLKDGKIVSDTNPYSVEDEEKEVISSTKDKTKKTKMSFFTALTLSFNNLMTKKTRTLLIALAGSIGIIGIALILAVSTGFQNYIDSIQEDTLTSYPLTIASESADITSALLAINESRKEQVDGDMVKERQTITSMLSSVSKNDLKSFKRYLEDNYNKVDADLSNVKYSYSVSPNIYTIDATNTLTKINPANMFRSNSLMSATGAMMSSVFREMVDNRESVEQDYEVLAGRWPDEYNEMIIVLSEPNAISDLLVYNLGLRDTKELKKLITGIMNGETVDIQNEALTLSYSDLMNIDLRLIMPADTYKYNSKFEVYEDMTEDEEYMHQLYENAVKLKIVGIVCAKEGVTSTALSTGVAYTSGLTDYILNYAKKTEIVNKQIASKDVDVFSGNRFDSQKNKFDFQFSDLVKVDRNKLQEAFDIKIDQNELAKQVQDYMTQIANAITVDTAPAKRMFDDNLKTLVNGLLDSIDGEFSQNDIPTIVDNYLSSYDSGQMLSDMESSYVLPKETFRTVYSGSLKGLLQAYITGYNSYMGMINPQFVPDSDNPKAIIMPTFNEMVVTGYLNNAAIVGTSDKMASVMTEALVKKTVLTQVGELTGTLTKNFASAFNIDPDKIASAFTLNFNEDEMARMFDAMMNSSELTQSGNLVTLGYQDKDDPTTISFYFNSFDGKEHFLAFLDDYSDKAEEDQKIKYTDTTGILMSSVKTIVDAVSYVLIAFVSISLVVSSIMIGVITYISVYERTKEIGILRAMGASKGNISSIFNAETFIIGLLSGLLGVGISYACIPGINMVLHHFTGNIPLAAALWPNHAMVLVMLAIILTLIGGLIPARAASKKDPVEALRSE